MIEGQPLRGESMTGLPTCRLADSPITVSSEHKEGRLFAADELADLPMPGGYRRSIDDWFRRLESPGDHPQPDEPGRRRLLAG